MSHKYLRLLYSLFVLDPKFDQLLGFLIYALSISLVLELKFDQSYKVLVYIFSLLTLKHD